jgi:hypothetical protein
MEMPYRFIAPFLNLRTRVLRVRECWCVVPIPSNDLQMQVRAIAIAHLIAQSSRYYSRSYRKNVCMQSDPRECESNRAASGPKVVGETQRARRPRRRPKPLGALLAFNRAISCTLYIARKWLVELDRPFTRQREPALID